MIRRWTMVDGATGRIMCTGSASKKADVPPAPEGQVRVDGRQHRGREVWFKDGRPEQRPKLDLPAVVERRVGERVDLDVPVGTRVYRNNLLIGEAGGRIEFTPTTAGTTPIRIEPPFPFKPATVTIVADREAAERQRADDRAAKAQAAGEGFAGVR